MKENDVAKPGPLQMMELTAEMIEGTGFTLEDLRSPYRGSILCHVRHTVMRALIEQGYTYSAVGRFLNRHHGAVLHALHGRKRKRRQS